MPRSPRDYRHQIVSKRQRAETAFFEIIDERSRRFGYAVVGRLHDSIRPLLRSWNEIRPEASKSIAESTHVAWHAPCAVRFQDGEACETALLLFRPVSAQTLLSFSSVRVGGELQEVRPSPFALPAPIAERAAATPDVRMGAFEPLVVRIRSTGECLVPAGAIFFSSPPFTGADIDPGWSAPPDHALLAKGTYRTGTDMHERIVAVLCDPLDARSST